MTARTGKRRKQVYFLLHQILPMRPLIERLQRDLRALVAARATLRREQAEIDALPRRDPERLGRLRRSEAEAARLTKARDEIRDECRSLGIRPSNDPSGEVQFPCSVDFRDAYFVWYGDEPRPTHWRFRGEEDVEAIPATWYAMFAPRPE
jgi:hypothetical protein